MKGYQLIASEWNTRHTRVVSPQRAHQLDIYMSRRRLVVLRVYMYHLEELSKFHEKSECPFVRVLFSSLFLLFFCDDFCRA